VTAQSSPPPVTFEELVEVGLGDTPLRRMSIVLKSGNRRLPSLSVFFHPPQTDCSELLSLTFLPFFTSFSLTFDLGCTSGFPKFSASTLREIDDFQFPTPRFVQSCPLLLFPDAPNIVAGSSHGCPSLFRFLGFFPSINSAPRVPLPPLFRRFVPPDLLGYYMILLG